MGKKKKKKEELKKRLEKNAEKARRKGYDRHRYLEELGLPLRSCGVNFCGKEDKRYGKWMKQRKEYGFDSRETWCLNHIFLQWLYERLMMYRKEASEIVDLTYHEFEIGGKKYSQIEAINRMIENLEYVLLKGDEFGYDEEADEKTKETLEIWTVVFPAMWW